MPVTVVLDHPRRHVARRLWRRVSGIAGAILYTTDPRGLKRVARALRGLLLSRHSG